MEYHFDLPTEAFYTAMGTNYNTEIRGWYISLLKEHVEHHERQAEYYREILSRLDHMDERYEYDPLSLAPVTSTTHAHLQPIKLSDLAKQQEEIRRTQPRPTPSHAAATAAPKPTKDKEKESIWPFKLKPGKDKDSKGKDTKLTTSYAAKDAKFTKPKAIKVEPNPDDDDGVQTMTHFAKPRPMRGKKPRRDIENVESVELLEDVEYATWTEPGAINNGGSASASDRKVGSTKFFGKFFGKEKAERAEKRANEEKNNTNTDRDSFRTTQNPPNSSSTSTAMSTPTGYQSSEPRYPSAAANASSSIGMSASYGSRPHLSVAVGSSPPDRPRSIPPPPMTPPSALSDHPRSMFTDSHAPSHFGSASSKPIPPPPLTPPSQGGFSTQSGFSDYPAYPTQPPPSTPPVDDSFYTPKASAIPPPPLSIPRKPTQQLHTKSDLASGLPIPPPPGGR